MWQIRMHGKSLEVICRANQKNFGTYEKAKTEFERMKNIDKDFDKNYSIIELNEKNIKELESKTTTQNY